LTCFFKSSNYLNFFSKIYGGERDEHNQRTGEGESLFPNGDRYTGGFLENVRNGQGLYVFGSQGTN